jgi:hypothetical protein
VVLSPCVSAWRPRIVEDAEFRARLSGTVFVAALLVGMRLAVSGS